jgi:hypothetical protein
MLKRGNIFKNMVTVPIYQQYIEMHQKVIAEQQELCKKYKVEWHPSSPDLKIGISKNISDGTMPVNGLRHSPEGDTSGWYVWAGDYSDSPDLFQPLHIDHLNEHFPLVLKYLGLPPGWRFQIDNKGHEDVWFDEKIIKP